MALLTAGSRERLHRDAQCAADVGKMQELGKFPSEFKIYGCANMDRKGDIYYRATTDEEKLYSYIYASKSSGSYFTPVVSLSKYIKVASDEKDGVEEELKHELIRTLKRNYEPEFFEAMKPLFLTKANDNSAEFFKTFAEEIYGYYDDSKLQVFLGFLETAYDGKVLSEEGYKRFYDWYDSIKAQMTDEPVSEGRHKRTFYGFVYFLDNGTEKTFVDARMTNTLQKREELLEEGKTVGQVLYKTYWFDELSLIREVKEVYKEWLRSIENETYFNRLEELKNLSGVIREDIMEELKQRFQNNPDAYRAVCHYDRTFNKRKA